VGLAVAGRQAYIDWVSVLRSIDVYGDYYNSSLRGFSQRLVGDWLGRPEWIVHVWLGLGGVAVAFAWWRLRRTRDIDVEWACVVLLSLLLSPLGWTYYLAL